MHDRDRRPIHIEAERLVAKVELIEAQLIAQVAYSAGEGELIRSDVPVTLLRLMRVGGRIRLMNIGMFGDDRDGITLEDLERHGPGLVVDTSGGSVGPMAVGDAIFGTNTRASWLPIWTE